MNKLLKILNKFNGNICFVGSTDSGDVIFECDRFEDSLTYAISSNYISGICLYDSISYLVAFSDNWVGRFSNGVLNRNYVDLSSYGISFVDSIIRKNSDEYYILNRTNNILYKFTWGTGIDWYINLPDYSLKHESHISFRGSDNAIIYNNNTNIYVIVDNTSYGVVLNSLSVSGSGALKVVTGGEFLPSYCYFRSRTVSAGDLDQSTSSFSSSSSSSP